MRHPVSIPNLISGMDGWSGGNDANKGPPRGGKSAGAKNKWKLCPSMKILAEYGGGVISTFSVGLSQLEVVAKSLRIQERMDCRSIELLN